MENSERGKWMAWIRTNAKWLGIITVLVLIIVFSLARSAISPTGKMAVKVESFAPKGETAQATNFTIEFSQDVVGEDKVGVQVEDALVAFSPPITGRYKWVARHILQFFPNTILLPSTHYTAEVLPKVCAETGYYLKGKRKFEFYTQRFRVESAYIFFRFSNPKEAEVPILGTVEFNYPVSPEDVRKYLTISYKGGEKIPYQIITSQPGPLIQLESSRIEHKDSEHKIQLVIDHELLPIGGSEGLPEDYIRTFALKPHGDLKVEGVFTERQAKYGYLKIRFNAPVDPGLAREFISVDPPVEYQTTSNYHYIELRGNFEPEKYYEVSIKEGLMGVDGSILKGKFSTKVFMQNMEPSIRFVGDGIYLSRRGNLNVGLSTVNIEKVEIEIRKVFANNLTHLIHTGGMDPYYYWYDINNLGKQIHKEELAIPTRPNEEVITPINMESYLKDEHTGIFDIVARDANEQWRSSHKLVMITDLGITVKKANEQFLVWVHSLSSLEPISGADTALISQNNQIIKKGTTDRNGSVIFQLTEKDSEEFTPFLVTVTNNGDLSFLELSRGQISTTDFDVGGFPYLQDGYNAFVYGDRNIYRPGEKAHLVTIVRGPRAEPPVPFPVKMEILGPDNRIFNEQKKRLNDGGACEFEVELPTYAGTGYYTVRIIVGKDTEIGRGGFSVEEFMPDRIKVKVETDSSSYNLGQDINIRVSAVSLFGPPASGRIVEAQSQIEHSQFSPLPWRSFTFSNPNKQFERIVNNLGKAKLDENGRYNFVQKLPTGISPPSSLSNIIAVTVHEPGGRAVTAYKTVNVHPYQYYVGLRQTKEDYAEVNRPKDMEFIVLDQKEQVVPSRRCEVQVFRITWQSILKRSEDGDLRYVSERQENLEESITVTSGAGPVQFKFIPVNYGEYRVEIRDMGGHSASINFYVSGWGYAPWAMDRPERLEVGLDKPSYKPGETAKVQIRSPFSGRLLLAVEGDKVYHTQSIAMDKNTSTVNIKVLKDYKPNVYVSASVIRSTISLERNAPVRAYGVAPLSVDCSENKLSIALDAPTEMQPMNPIKIHFTVSGRNKGAYVTIAAVDEGICQLTGFQTPDPFGYFFGKKRLEVTSHDIYSAVLPEIERVKTPSTAPGGEPGELRRRISPVSVARVKPVALWSGLVKTDKDGKGSVTFDVPQFNGSLRVMAVSFSEDRFGSAYKNVIVRDPIVLTPTFPRFIAGGDHFLVPVNVFNGTGRADRFAITLDAQGPVEKPQPGTQTISLAPNEEGQVVFSVRAKELMGKVTFMLSADGYWHSKPGGGGKRVTETTDVPLRPASPPITLTGSGTVKAGSSARFTIPGNWIPGTAEFDLSLSSLPAIQFAGSLQYLLRYPYGCAEQTTSSLFPLLYFNDIAKLVEPGLFGAKSPDYFIEEGITKLENMQMPSGDFAFWPSAGYGNPWASIYVSHFLVEARKAGYEVSERVYRNMIKALQSHAKMAIRNDWDSQIKVYACYVLAKAGEPEKSVMLYLKDTQLSKMPDYSQFQLAGAFAFSGDLNTAFSLLPSTVLPRDVKRETGRNFNSTIRADAIMLDVLAEVNPDHPSVPKLIERLAKSADQNNRWYTTQENAFAFLALGKILKKQPPGRYRGTIKVNGALLANFDSKDHHFSDKNWGGKEITIDVEGTGTCYYYWKAFGIPAEGDVKEFDSELKIRRRYLNEAGKPIDYSQFHQGDLIVAEITAKSLAEDLDNVVIADLLPAGFEIENPRLGSRAGIPWIKEAEFRPDYMDIRDDRMLLFVSLPRQKERKFYYALRVVNVGDFVLPPIQGEAMYDPAKASVSAGGRVKVIQ